VIMDNAIPTGALNGVRGDLCHQVAVRHTVPFV